MKKSIVICESAICFVLETITEANKTLLLSFDWLCLLDQNICWSLVVSDYKTDWVQFIQCLICFYLYCWVQLTSAVLSTTWLQNAFSRPLTQVAAIITNIATVP